MSWQRIEQSSNTSDHYIDLEDFGIGDDGELLSEPEAHTRLPEVRATGTQTDTPDREQNTASGSATRSARAPRVENAVKWARLLRKYLAIRKQQLLFSNLGNHLQQDISKAARDRVIETYPYDKGKRR